MTEDKKPKALRRDADERDLSNSAVRGMSDTSVTIGSAPDADYHTEAMANAVVDSEAGAMPDNDEGGITPLKSRNDSK